jgi:hypothetical protein
MSNSESTQRSRVSKRPCQSPTWCVTAVMILLSLAACVPAPPPPPPPPWNGGSSPAASGPVYHGGALITDRTAPIHTPGTLCYTVSGWCTLGGTKPIPADCDCQPARGAPVPTGSVD